MSYPQTGPEPRNRFVKFGSITLEIGAFEIAIREWHDRPISRKYSGNRLVSTFVQAANTDKIPTISSNGTHDRSASAILTVFDA